MYVQRHRRSIAANFNSTENPSRHHIALQMEPNLDEMAIAESCLAASDSHAPTPHPRPAATSMGIELDEGPIGLPKQGEEDEGASMNVAIEEREVESAAAGEKASAQPAVLQTPQVQLQTALDDLNATLTSRTPETSNVRAAHSPVSRPTDIAFDVIPPRDATDDPLAEIAGLIQEAQQDQPPPRDAAETMLELSTRTVVVESRVEAVVTGNAEVQEERVEGMVERVEDRTSLSIPLPVVSSSPNPERRPGPTLSSLAALSVSPVTSGEQLSKTAEQLPVPPAVSPNVQQNSELAQTVNLSAQVNPAEHETPHLSAATTIPTEYGDGETDDAEGETDPGEDVLNRGTNSDAEEEFMNGLSIDPSVRPGDPGFTDYLYRAHAKNRGRGKARGTATAARGTGRPRATGPKRLIVEVILPKYKRLKFKPTANDDVAIMLRAPLGFGAEDPVNPDLAFAHAGQFTNSSSVSGSRSASILPPPPVSDPALLGSPNAGSNTQKKADQRHRNYDSDEEHADFTTFPPKEPRKRVPKPQATANAVVGAVQNRPSGAGPSNTVPASAQDTVPAASVTGMTVSSVPASLDVTAPVEMPDVQMADPGQSAGLPQVEAAAASTGQDQPTANGSKSNRPKPRKRAKKVEQELNDALLSLVSDNDEPNEDMVTQPDTTQTAPKPKKPRKSKAQKEAEAAAAEAAAPPESEPEPEPVVPVLAPRRKLKIEQSWLHPDDLPVAVPYPLRYYISVTDGQPIVSWRESEESGVHSNRPEGTIYEDGNRVNPAGSVDKPEDRRANTACEFCRFR